MRISIALYGKNTNEYEVRLIDKLEKIFAERVSNMSEYKPCLYVFLIYVKTTGISYWCTATEKSRYNRMLLLFQNK